MISFGHDNCIMKIYDDIVTALLTRLKHWCVYCLKSTSASAVIEKDTSFVLVLPVPYACCP